MNSTLRKNSFIHGGVFVFLCAVTLHELIMRLRQTNHIA